MAARFLPRAGGERFLLGLGGVGLDGSIASAERSGWAAVHDPPGPKGPFGWVSRAGGAGKAGKTTPEKAGTAGRARAGRRTAGLTLSPCPPSSRTSSSACGCWRRRPASPLVAALSLALGIGANTTIFTLVNAVLLNPLPVEDPAQLVSVWTTDERNHGTARSVSCRPRR